MAPESGSDCCDHKSTSPVDHQDNLGADTPQSHVPSQRTLSPSPWAQIVRGEQDPRAASRSSSPAPSTTTAATMTSTSRMDQSASVAVASPSTSSTSTEKEGSGDSGSNSNAAKNPAWRKPSNASGDVGPVMGAESWPPLSESTRAPSHKSTTSESLKGLYDGSIYEPTTQGAGASSPANRLVNMGGNENASPVHPVSSRQRSFKKNGSSASSNGGSPHPLHQVTSQGSLAETPGNNHPSKDHNPRGASVSQSQASNDNQQQRNSFRNRNNGPRPRGDGIHNQNYGGRRGQEQGNLSWHPHRNYSGRDVHMQSHRGFSRFQRNTPPPPPPPTSAHYIAPSVRPFGGHMTGFPDFVSPVYYAPVPPPPPLPTPDSLRGVPMVAPLPPHPLFVPVCDPMYISLWNQIAYYFSDENLIKDDFLRKQMDDHGWLPVTLIAGFNRVRSITENIQLVLEVARNMPILEVKGDKLRRRGDWWKWPIKSSAQAGSVGNMSDGRNGVESVENGFQTMRLDQKWLGESSATSEGEVEGDDASRSLNGEGSPPMEDAAGGQRRSSVPEGTG